MDVLGEAFKRRDDIEVVTLDPVSTDVREPALGALLRCIEMRCATELGNKVGVDEVVHGVLDGSEQPPILRIWRVDVRAGTVTGMFSTRVTDDALTRVSEDPNLVLNALLEVGDVSRPAVRWQPPPPKLSKGEVKANARPAAVRRELLLRAVGSAGLGLAVAGAVTGLAVVALYGALVVYNAVYSQQLGVNAVSIPVGLALDLGAMVALLGVLISVPVGALSVVALMLPANLLRGKKE